MLAQPLTRHIIVIVYFCVSSKHPPIQAAQCAEMQIALSRTQIRSSTEVYHFDFGNHSKLLHSIVSSIR